MVHNKILAYRKQFKVTQDDLAKELEVTKQYVSKLEKEYVIPGLEACFKILNAFEKITEKKSNGHLTAHIKLDDMFYVDD